MKTLIFLCLTNYITLGEVNAFGANDIKLWVFAEQTRDIKYTEFRMLEQLGFRKDLPTVLVTHGYLAGYALIEEFRKAYKDDILKTLNFIGIDWSASSDWYPTTLKETRIVGDAVGEFIVSAIINNIMQQPVHVVGHSLGAHVAGFIGKYMAKKGRYLYHITGLDPAGPCIGSYACPDRLCSSDAHFVEVIHSNGGALGMMAEIKPLDLYLNGGRKQIHCNVLNPPCSHSYAHEWYRQKVHGFPFHGWKCNDLKQMETEEKCKLQGNPRLYQFEIIQEQSPENLGITYVPTGNSGPLTDSRRRTTFSSNRRNMNTTQSDDYTLVVFGIGKNDDTVNELVSLLSDDGHLQVQLSADKATFTNPINFAWRPDPKYVIFSEKSPEAIDEFLSKLRRPYRLVVPFDINDMFTDSFWMTLRHFAEVQNSAMHDSAPNELKTIAMHLPHDNIPLKDHLDDLKHRIDYGLDYSADFEMLGMHEIERSGPVNTMPQLVAEVAAIKGTVGFV